MATARSGLPDWRDASAYAPLLGAQKSGLAWEWLRRDEVYRAVARNSMALRGPGRPSATEPAAAAWGLHMFADPRLGAFEASPMWRAEWHPAVLRSWSAPSDDLADAIRLDQLTARWNLVIGGREQHFLLSENGYSLRLDIAGCGLLDGPVRLHYRLAGIAAASAPLATLQRFLTLVRSGCLAAPKCVTRPARLVTLLRVGDAVRAGASQRDIAAVLLDAKVSHARWRVRSPSVRSMAQRMVRSAVALAGGDWMQLLR